MTRRAHCGRHLAGRGVLWQVVFRVQARNAMGYSQWSPWSQVPFPTAHAASAVASYPVSQSVVESACPGAEEACEAVRRPLCPGAHVSLRARRDALGLASRWSCPSLLTAKS